MPMRLLVCNIQPLGWYIHKFIHKFDCFPGEVAGWLAFFLFLRPVNCHKVTMSSQSLSQCHNVVTVCVTMSQSLSQCHNVVTVCVTMSQSHNLCHNVTMSQSLSQCHNVRRNISKQAIGNCLRTASNPTTRCNFVCKRFAFEHCREQSDIKGCSGGALGKT